MTSTSAEASTTSTTGTDELIRGYPANRSGRFYPVERMREALGAEFPEDTVVIGSREPVSKFYGAFTGAARRSLERRELRGASRSLVFYDDAAFFRPEPVTFHVGTQARAIGRTRDAVYFGEFGWPRKKKRG